MRLNIYQSRKTKKKHAQIKTTISFTIAIAAFVSFWFFASSSNIHENSSIALEKDKEDEGKSNLSTTSQRTDVTQPNLLFILSNDVSDPMNLTQLLVTSDMYYTPKDTFVDIDVEKQSQIILHDQSFETKHDSSFDNALAIERIRQWKIDFEHLKEFLHKLYVFETTIKEEEHNRYHTYIATDPQLSVTLSTWLHFLKVQPAIVWITSHPLETTASKLPETSITNRELHRWILHHRYSISNMKDRKLCTVRSSYDKIENSQSEMQRIAKELETKCNIIPSVSAREAGTIKSKNIFKFQLKKIQNECSLEDFGFSAYLNRGIIMNSIDKDIFIIAMKLYCEYRE